MDMVRKEKEWTYLIRDFLVAADHVLKLEEIKNRNKFLDIPRELRKLRNKNVTVTPIVIGAFGTVTKVSLTLMWKPLKQLNNNNMKCTWQNRGNLDREKELP